jgi:hypothetical protein
VGGGSAKDAFHDITPLVELCTLAEAVLLEDRGGLGIVGLLEVRTEGSEGVPSGVTDGPAKRRAGGMGRIQTRDVDAALTEDG